MRSAGAAAIGVLGGIIVLSACGDDAQPAEVPLPDDPRLGVRVSDLPPLRPVSLEATWDEDGIDVAVYAETGPEPGSGETSPASFRIVRFDPSTQAVSEVPPPPGPPTAATFGRVLGHGVLLVVRSTPPHLAFFGGTGWTDVPFPDGLGAQDARRVVARDAGAMIVDTETSLHAWNGSAWTIVSPAGGATAQAMLGPWDEQGARLVYRRGSRLATVLLDASFAPSGDPVEHAMDVADVRPAALNGTSGDFQLLVRESAGATSARLLRFSGGSFAVGDEIDADFLGVAPSAQRSLAYRLPDPGPTESRSFGTFTTVEAARAGMVALGPFQAHLGCACDRSTDPSCGCAARDLAVPILGFAADATRAVLVTGDNVPGTVPDRRLYVRVLDLPFDGDPMALATR